MGHRAHNARPGNIAELGALAAIPAGPGIVTVSTPLTANPDYMMLEYACREGNQAVRNTLSGGRYQDSLDR